MGAVGRKISLQTRYIDPETRPASKPVVMMPRVTDSDLRRMRERARHYAACGYSIGVIEMLLGVGEHAVRVLLGLKT